MKHHMIKEQDMIDTCPYCNHHINFTDWSTEFDVSAKYGTFKCECGMDVRVELNNILTTSNNWDEKMTVCLNKQEKEEVKGKDKLKTLESRIKIIKEYKEYTLQKGK